jgi:hypothetical protein
VGQYILKAERDRDLYVVWSTIVDNAVWAGTRLELDADPEYDSAPERMARVETTGSSAHTGTGSWDDPSLWVCNLPEPLAEPRLLPRANLAAYIAAGENAAIIAALTAPA